MGGKSRKTGAVSKKLIERILAGGAKSSKCVKKAADASKGGLGLGKRVSEADAETQSDT